MNSTNDRPSRGPGLRAFRFLASYLLAIVLMAILAVVLAWATFAERRYGVPAMRFGVYNAWWFHVLIAAIGLNVLLSLVARWPWRRSQAAFLVSHAGILLLIAGCALTNWFGVEASLPVYEGQENSEAVRQDAQDIVLTIRDLAAPIDDDADAIELPFEPGPFSWRDYNRMSGVAMLGDTPGDAPKWSLPWAVIPRDQGVLHDSDGVVVEAIDYYENGESTSAAPLKLSARCVPLNETPTEDDEPSAQDEAPPTWTDLELQIGGEQGMPEHGAMSSTAQQSLPDGTRVYYSVAKSPTEQAAFEQALPEGELGVWGQLTVSIDGDVHRIDVDELLEGSQSLLPELGRAEMRQRELQAAFDREPPTSEMREKLQAELDETTQRLAEIQTEMRTPLGDTDWSLSLQRFVPAMPLLFVHLWNGDEQVDEMRFFGNVPVANRHAPAYGAYGYYWVDGDAVEQAAADALPPAMLARLKEPRIELVQTTNGALLARTWADDRVHRVEPLPLNGDTWRAFDENGPDTAIRVEGYAPNDCPWGLLTAKPFKTPDARSMERIEPWVRLRVTIDGREETFWLKQRAAMKIPQPPAENETYTVLGDGRAVDVQWRPGRVDLGFAIRLHEFQRELDAGTSKPAAYWSRVDVLDSDGEPIAEDVTISLNRPPTFTDPKTGRPYRVYQSSFNGPELPGEVVYQALTNGEPLPGETLPRDQIYQSVFTANYDPGRGLKYLGCLMMVLGVMFLFFRGGRKSASTGATVKAASSVIALLFLGMGSAAQAQSGWMDIPVFHEGRVVPLTTFSNDTAEAVTGRTNLLVRVDESDLRSMTPAWRKRVKKLLPSNGRYFTSQELLFAWLADRPTWERIPILPAEGDEFRKLIDVEPRGENGRPLTHVSPMQVYQSPTFWELYDEARRDAWGGHAADDEPSARRKQLFQKAMELYDAYDRFYRVTYNPCADAPERLMRRFDRAQDMRVQTPRSLPGLWRRTAEQWMQHGAIANSLGDDAAKWTVDDDLETLGQGLQGLAERLLGQEDRSAIPTARELDDEVTALSAAADRLARQTAEIRDTAFEQDPPGGYTDEMWSQVRSDLHVMATTARLLARDLDQSRLELYDNGESLLITPSLNGAALSTRRQPGDHSQPWLSIQTYLYGSDAVIQRFADPDLAIDDDDPAPTFDPSATPIEQIASLAKNDGDARPIRAEFLKAAEIYVDSGSEDPDYAKHLLYLGNEASELSHRMEPARRAMMFDGRTEKILDATAYPADRVRVYAEQLYTALDPFYWTWFISGFAVLFFATSRIEIIRPAAFWLGLLALLAFLVVGGVGFGLRAYVTGWVPVTNMFETISLVAWIVVVAGIALALWFVDDSGLRRAWALTSFRAPDDGRPSRPVVRMSLLSARIALVLAALWIVVQISFGGHEDATLWQSFERSLPALLTVNGLVDAAVVCSLIVVVAWLLGWLLAAACVGVVTVPKSLLSNGSWRRISGLNCVLMLAAAFVAMLVSGAGYFNSAEFDPSIKIAVAILRSNFWLAFHVFTIAVGYAFGVLAWAVGMIVLGIHAFGPLRKDKDSAMKPTARLLTEIAIAVIPIAAIVTLVWLIFGGYTFGVIAWTLCIVVLVIYSYGPMQGDAEPSRMTASLSKVVLGLMQIAALFILIGTITGARWADFSWGRFWSWDPKEVWALITLLVYLVVLHAHRARYFSQLGLNIGAVTGAIAIVLTWYGINFVFAAGRHAYGHGESKHGAMVMWAFVVLNVYWPLIAATVYFLRRYIASGGATADEANTP